MSGLEGLLTGRTLVKRYCIEEVIGRGGFAVVYRAADERLGRMVAVKVITAPAPDPETRVKHQEQFEREARAAASLSHPNVVTVHDFGTDPSLDIDFLVMEFLHGEDVATYLSRNGRPPLDLAIRVLADAAQGLAVGHRAGLVHRDVKPGNLFLAEPHGEDPFRVCVLDFGIARAAEAENTLSALTQGGVALSPAYASPEQARGERDLTPATDVFSLGVVGYQLLTGRKPFTSERPDDPAGWVPAAGLRELEPGVPPEVEAVILRSMSFAPGDRFPDAAAMARALNEALGSGSASSFAAFPSVPTVRAGVPHDAPRAAPEDATLLQPAPVAAAPPPRTPAPAPPPERRGPRAAVWVMLLLLVVGAGAVGVMALGGGDGEGGGAAGEGVRGAALAVPETGEEPPPEGAEPEVRVEESFPAPSPADRAGGNPSPASAAPSLPLPGGGGAQPSPASPPSATPPGGNPATTQPAAPVPGAPRPTPAPAAADTAGRDSTPPPRILGTPVGEPRPAPRDTAVRPRPDTAAAPPPAADTAGGGGRTR